MHATFNLFKLQYVLFIYYNINVDLTYLLLTGQELNTLIGHNAEIVTINFNNTGNEVITASFDNTIKIWDYRVSG